MRGLGPGPLAAFAAGLLLASVSRSVLGQEPHWDYSSHGGPEGWSEVYPACGLPGRSPLNITDSAPRGGLRLNYQPTPLVVMNNGHTIQVQYQPGSSMTVDGKVYELLQFHFHSPGENMLNGLAAAMEVHFVHRAADGQLAVLAALMTEGTANSEFQDVLDLMPKVAGNAASLRTIDGAALLPAELAHYAYEGSLTTPPCTGGVQWLVLRQLITVSPAQLAAFRGLEMLSHAGSFVGNARPIRNSGGPSNIRPDSSGITPPAAGSGGLAVR